MSHWTIRRCSNNCQGVCGDPLGLRPRSLLGKSCSSLAASTWASAFVSRLTRLWRRGSAFSIAHLISIPKVDRRLSGFLRSGSGRFLDQTERIKETARLRRNGFIGWRDDHDGQDLVIDEEA